MDVPLKLIHKFAGFFGQINLGFFGPAALSGDGDVVNCAAKYD
jgi:hypothetical protein